MDVFNGCFLIQLKKNMLRKEIDRLLSKDMWMFPDAFNGCSLIQLQK